MIPAGRARRWASADDAPGPQCRQNAGGQAQLGEHTDEVLAAELGLGPRDLAALRAGGVIG